jgi:ACDE family multidrug resistance protein
MRRTTVILLFASIFTAELGWAGISPLLPSYQARYGVTDVAAGLIVAVASVGILAVSLPAGGLTNRFAVRSLTLWSLAALTAGNLIVGLSASYPILLAGRAVFGVGLGTMWVTGTAWLHDAAGGAGPRALALTTSVVGIASLVGPSLTGWLGERYSLGTAFVLLGLLTGTMFVGLAVLPSATGRVAGSGPPLREMLRAARADRLMLTSLVLTLAVALMWMSAELLVPLRLAERGFTASRIGFAFSAASVVFVGASAVASARAERYATTRVATAWTLVYATCVLIAVAGVGTVPTVAFLAAMGLTTGVLVALTYPLGAAGAAGGGFNVAVVGALINVVWAGSGLVGPVVGGLAAERADDRVWFAGLAVCAFAAAAWIARRRAPVTERDARSRISGLVAVDDAEAPE